MGRRSIASCGVAVAVLACGCSRSSQGAPAQPIPSAAASAAPDAGARALDAAPVTDTGLTPAKLVPGVGRVFFGKWTTQNPAIATQELYVGRAEDAGARAFFLGDPDEWPVWIDPVGHLWPTKVAPEPLELTLYDDGSFEGEHRYTDGSKSTWIRMPFVPAGADELAQATGFEGYLADTVRYRVKIAFVGEAVLGVARYPSTRAELPLRGKVDRATRAVTADELDRDGHVTGHVDAILLGHAVSAPFSRSAAIAGTWSSPDGKRRLSLHLEQGYYPDRVEVPSGRSLSAQEIYTRDCDIIREVVYPVLEGAPKPVTEALEASFKKLAFQEQSDDVQRMAPGARIKRSPCRADPERRGTDSAVFTATVLHDSWVAVQFEHYAQEGSISGRVWYDCVAVDLATGEIVAPAKLLDAATRATLTARARKEALASLGPPSSAAKDPLYEGSRSAAADLSLEDVPLCIEKSAVRFALASHRVFGPAPPVFDRAVVAGLLPPGKLRALLAPVP